LDLLGQPNASLAAQLAPTATERAAAAETVAAMLDYMLENDYSLRDWTGYATTWGRWAPCGAHQ
jgi:hypothetical protein